MKTISASAFAGTGLTSITIPSSVTSIGASAFAGTAITSVTIPSSVTSIGANAFSGCPGLVELVLPAGITHFASNALGTSGPVYVYGAAGSYLEGYADSVANLYLIPVE